MKIIYLIITLLISSCAYAQTVDTIIVVSEYFKTKIQKNFKPLNIVIKNDTLYINNPHVYLSSKWKYFDKEAEELLNIITSGQNYYIFFDQNKRRIEEGYWKYSKFDKRYINYYKNGSKKCEGFYCMGVKCKNWYYYKKNGELKHVKQYLE